MKKFLYIIPFVLLLSAACQQQGGVGIGPTPSPGQCTTEALICPDGSAVGRSGPNCQFAPCPSVTSTPTPKISATPNPTVTSSSETSGIEGVVTLGPTCPVVQNPPVDSCADKPYQAIIKVQTADGGKEITKFTSDAQGAFKISLQPGTYLLVPVNGEAYPRAGSQQVTIEKGKFAHVIVQFDSGIR